MPPRISWSTLTPSSRSALAPRHIEFRASTLLCEYASPSRLCNPPVVPFLSATANFATAPAKRAVTDPDMRSMPPQQRLEQRRRHQIDTDARALERNFNRDWRAGDVYAPHDLSAAEARKWKKKQNPTQDAFDALSLNPLDCYKNFSIMSEYMTEMGRIRHSRETGLRPVNQRKIAKAIRRAVGIGLMPSVHRHPELIKRAIQGERQTGRYP